MSGGRALLWDSGAVLGLKGAGAAFAFLLNLAVARLLGADGAGIYYFALAITTLAATAALFGQDLCVVRFCAARRAREGIGAAAAVLRRSLAIVALLSVATAAGLAPALFGLASVRESNAGLLSAAGLMCAAIVPFALGKMGAEALRALGRVRLSQLLLMAVTPAAVLVLMVPLAAAYGVHGAVGAYVGAQAAVAAVALLLAWRAYRAPSTEPVETAPPRLLAVGASFVQVALMQQLIAALPITVLGFLAAPGEVGAYGVALRLSMPIAMAGVVVNAVAAPRIAALHAGGDRVALWRLLRQAVAGTAAFGAVAFAAVWGFADALLGLFGPAFVAARPILLVLAVAQLFVAATALCAQALAMTGAETPLRNGYGIATLVLVAATLALVPAYGDMGAAVATALAIVARNGWLCREVRRHLAVEVSVLSPAFWVGKMP